MIYQLNHDFFVYSFKTVIDGQEYYLDDKDEFERELNLPAHPVYEDVVLTQEQKERFELVAGVKGITLDEVVAYTINGEEPSNPYYQIMKLKRENEDLTIALAEIMGV